MTFLKRILTVALVSLGLLAPLGLSAGITNVDALQVMSPGTSGSAVVLSPVTEVWEAIPLTSILTGSNGTTALADTAITTGLYVAQATGTTNSAAVVFPAQTDAGTASFKWNVPWNYLSGARLVLGWHANSTFTAGALSFTADAYISSLPWATTQTTKTSGTAVQINTAASYQKVTQAATLTLSVQPMQTVDFKLAKAGTLALPQLQNIWVVYRPYGVLNGQCVSCLR